MFCRALNDHKIELLVCKEIAYSFINSPKIAPVWALKLCLIEEQNICSLKNLPGAIKTSFFFDLRRKNVMSFVGSKSRMVDLAYKKIMREYD